MHLITDNGNCILPVKVLGKHIPEPTVTSLRLRTPIDESEIPLTMNNATVFVIAFSNICSCKTRDLSHFTWSSIIDKSGETITTKGFEGKLWPIDFRHLHKGDKI